MLVKVNIQIEENMKQTSQKKKKSKTKETNLQTKGQSTNIQEKLNFVLN